MKKEICMSKKEYKKIIIEYNEGKDLRGILTLLFLWFLAGMLFLVNMSVLKDSITNISTTIEIIMITAIMSILGFVVIGGILLGIYIYFDYRKEKIKLEE